ncbi:ABC transporter ATP-binding protein [Mesoterricola silvestris]|uniref:Lipid A ABC transporter permease/ATP-binding protein n=1 Tax=Mesoterricola silvestris TaxID=2927979 RepID=A0AA48H7V9_9BACT|nr:ABC transporter ATP-binding protein [Mesoterricola silvestris]BDU73398.1 lipid A ABC transporter permease/ATP-binding protein [Mesoterricola silvestris]
MADSPSSFFHSDQVDQQPGRHALLARLVGYLRPYWAGLCALLVLMAAGAVLDVLPSEFTLRLIDHHLAKGTMRGSGPLVAAFLGFVLLGFVVQVLRYGLLAWVGQMAMLDLRMQVFRHLMKRSTHFFHRNPVGRLMTRVISDVQNLNEMFSSGFVAIVGDALSLTAIVIWMFSKHVGLALVAVGIMPLLLLSTEIFRRYASAAYRETQGRYAAIQAYLAEQLSGISLVQMNGQEAASRALFGDLNQKYLDAFLRTIFAYAVFFPVVEFITNGTLAALILYSGYKLQAGTLTLGLLLAFIQQSGRFFRPIRELAERYNVMQTALASSERIFKLLDNQDEIREVADPKPVAFTKEVRLEGVTFAYEPEGRKVVRDLSGVIPKGRRVAVVGHTGAGKSTLINLLMRFYDVDGGRVTVDGVDVREASLKRLRGLFGLVLQDVFVFSGTLEENIVLGRPHNAERLASVLEQSQLEDLVGRLPMGLLTQVGERGQKLSAGERQLVAFARMLYQEPEILLLDEATANIDSETENKIQQVIERVSHRLTTFTIAHRLSTIKDADEIWVMDQGQLVERGSHDGLMEQGGTYAKLVRLQFEGEGAVS